MSYLFVPKDFKAPFQVKTEFGVVKKLTVKDAEKDYKAVMSNKEELRQVFCDNDDWPSDDMTLEENIEDLQEHEQEFDNNEGFTYTILDPNEDVCIGCLYIFPFPHGVYDSRVFYWLIKEYKDIEMQLRDFIDQWLSDSFQLNHPAYPGRDMSHTEWKKIVNAIKTTNNQNLGEIK